VGGEVQVSIFEGGLQEENKSLGFISLVRKKTKGKSFHLASPSSRVSTWWEEEDIKYLAEGSVCVCVCVFCFVLMKDRG